MSKIFYIEDEYGEYESEDHKKRYRRLQGDSLKQYLSSAKGKQKRFYIVGNIGIEIPKDKIKEFRQAERRDQYLSDIRCEYPYSCVSIYTDVFGEELSGEEVIADDGESVQETVIHKIMLERLRAALFYLPEKERKLIQALYLDEPPMKQEEYAGKLGISQQAVSRQIAAVLKKLRKWIG